MHKTNYISLVCLVLWFTASVSADIYISEILYSPLVTESGGEAVELYNSGTLAVDVSGYTIKTASSARDAILPPGSSVPPGGYFLITDADWSSKKDSAQFPDSDHEEPITMSNTNSGVALINIQNQTVDRVGWGDPSLINQELFAGTPAISVPKGNSLIRIKFSNDNSEDFMVSSPQLTNSRGQNKSTSAGVIDLLVEIQSLDDLISSVAIDYDIDNSIMLLPGEPRVLHVVFNVTREISTSHIELAGQIYDARAISDTQLTAEISLDFYMPPDSYNLTIFAEVSEGISEKQVPFQILPLMGFEIDLESVNCSITSSESCQFQGDIDITTPQKPTLRNLGNVPLNFKIFGGNFSSGEDTFDIKSARLSFGGEFMEINTEPQLIPLGLAPGELSVLPLTLQITAPGEVKSGRYSSKLTFLGIADEA